MKIYKLFIFHPATYTKQKQQLLKASVQMSIADSVTENIPDINCNLSSSERIYSLKEIVIVSLIAE